MLTRFFKDKIIFVDSLFNSLPPALALGGFPQQSPDQGPHLVTSKSPKSDHFEIPSPSYPLDNLGTFEKVTSSLGSIAITMSSPPWKEDICTVNSL